MGKRKRGSYRRTLEIVSPLNCQDGVENHTEPIVEGFFDIVSLTDARGAVALRFCNVQDRM